MSFYLTKRLSKIFMDYLDKGVLVDFEISKTKRKIANYQAYQVAYFNEVKLLKTRRKIYSHSALKLDMLEFLEKKDYYLIVDLEMTMPRYRERKFKPEIIQYGFVLVEYRGKTVLEDSAYILPVKQTRLSKRTINFLNLDYELFYEKAKPYKHFYNSLLEIFKKYQPKIVVWGKNDISAIQISYNIHNMKAITNENDFVDLSKLHKDYFNLKDDLGLFNAYETYYNKKHKQIHSAKEDAVVTKNVFEAFVNYISNDIYKN